MVRREPDRRPNKPDNRAPQHARVVHQGRLAHHDNPMVQLIALTDFVIAQAIRERRP